jgi:hypothetical protein
MMDRHHDDSSSNGSNSFYDNQLMKERLNLHVKRRIQETNLQCHNSNSSNSPEKKDFIGNINPSTNCSNVKKLPKKTKLKQQNSNDSIPDADVDVPAEKSPKSHKPDIFTMVLNQKKSSLMQDAEVIEFFNTIYQTRSENVE